MSDTVKSALVHIGRRLRTTRSVALVALDWTRQHDPRVPLGHASIAANLAAHGIATSPLVYAVQHADEDAIVDDIISTGADIVAFGVYVWNVALVRRLVTRLREHETRATIVAGGPEVTYAPVDELVDRFTGVDVFVRGAGEDALVALARGERDVEGVVFAANLTGAGGFATAALERLPSPWLTGVLPLERGQAMVRWETARGCSYGCSFCAHHGEPEQRRIRRRDRMQLAREVELFVSHDVKRVNVLDPLFNANVEHASAVLDLLIAAGFSGELTFQCRFLAMRADPAALLDRFARLNVELEFGIQTTDELVGDAVHRRSEVDIAEATIAALHERAIRFSVSVIYGLPRQTLASFQATLAWCERMRIPVVNAFPLSLLVGTELWHQREELGLVEGRDVAMANVPIVVETPWMSREDMKKAHALAVALPRKT